jgi:HK97 gp10 family phage protein
MARKTERPVEEAKTMAARFVFAPPAAIRAHLAQAAMPHMATLAQAIAADAQRAAPVATAGEDAVPGELRDSITGTVEQDAGGLPTAIIAASAPYAVFVELGTSKTPAQPYLHPSLYKTRGL